MKDRVRLVLVGDPGVGKSSLISDLIHESFQPTVQAVLPIVVLPPEVVQEKAQISIVDTPSAFTKRLQSQRDDELRAADAVIVVYDVTRLETLERVQTYWLPHLRKLKLSTPVVLVGNKMDDRDGSPASGVSSRMEAAIKPVMDAFPEVDVCIECSAKKVFNVWEVFLFALRAVLHPTGPLYNVSSLNLQPAARMALTRIFHLCDVDGDGYMDDKELNAFQQMCFGVPLHKEELLGVKQVVRSGCLTGSGLNSSDHLTVDGFVFLHFLFIQKGRLETTWTVLRKFGYEVSASGNLELDKELLATMVPVMPEQGVELSADAKEFLSKYFDSLPGAPSVSEKNIREAFNSVNADAKPFDPLGCSPAYLPHDGLYSKDEFLARFGLLLLDELFDFLVLIAALGYNKPIASAVTVTPPRPRDRSSSSPVTRETLTVFVLGTPKQGASSLLRALLRDSSDFSDASDRASAGAVTEDEQPNKSGAAAYRTYIEDESAKPSKRLLVLRSVPQVAAKSIAASKRGLDLVDGAVLMYDAASSASACEATQIFDCLLRNTRAMLPVLFVCVCQHGVAPDSAVEEYIQDFCAKQGLAPPLPLWLNEQWELSPNGGSKAILDTLLTSVITPQKVCPGVFKVEGSGSGSTAAKVGKVLLGSAAAVAVLYGAKKAYEWYTTSNSSDVQVSAA
ncbi:hypothetical protein MMPV_007283 [Pyropia vietnamensis]